MNNLYKAITSNYSDYDSNVVEELTFLVKQHDLKWLMFEGEPYFIMSQVCEAKGRAKGDYASNWADSNLPGTSIKLENALLKGFKVLYKETYSESLGRVNTLYIGDYLLTYHYLKVNTCANTPRMHFKEVDIEEVYQTTFGGERQLTLPSGRVDVINGDEIIEIKKDTIDCNAVGQLLRYLNTSNRVKGKLVAPSITNDAINLIGVLNLAGYSLKYVTVDIKKQSV